MAHQRLQMSFFSIFGIKLIEIRYNVTSCPFPAFWSYLVIFVPCLIVVLAEKSVNGYLMAYFFSCAYEKMTIFGVKRSKNSLSAVFRGHNGFVILILWTIWDKMSYSELPARARKKFYALSKMFGFEVFFLRKMQKISKTAGKLPKAPKTTQFVHQ